MEIFIAKTGGLNSQQQITNNDSPRLQQMYHEDGARHFETPEAFEGIGSSETLVINCHGSAKSLEKWKAADYFDEMLRRGFKGCKDIHLYACSPGKGTDSFAQELTNLIKDKLGLDIPVWAPVATLAWDSTSSSFKVEGYAAGKGWREFTPKKKGSYGSVDSSDTSAPPLPAPPSKCTVSTACVSALSLPDDCPELETLRWFRDNYVRSLPGGEEAVQEYYRLADRLVEAIEALPEANSVFAGIYYSLVVPCVELVRRGAFAEALAHYYRETRALCSRFIAPGEPGGRATRR